MAELIIDAAGEAPGISQKEWEGLERNDLGTRRARKALGAELILDLDTSITLDQYEGPASAALVEALANYGEVKGEAWKVAFLSHLEAYQLATEAGCTDDIWNVVDLIRWCRGAVGLSEEFATAKLL